WMRLLFEDKILEQKEALQDVKDLADVIASQRTTLTETDMLARSSTTTGASTITRSGDRPRATTGSHGPVWRGSGVVAAMVLGGTALALTRRCGTVQVVEEPAAATAAQPPVEEKKGQVVVSSTPEGAYVRVAGELVPGQTPLTLDKLPLGAEIEIKV